METLLKVINLSKTFGGLSALRGISFEAKRGQIVGIIGPNGAGKTTLFNCLTGFYYPTQGQILFGDRAIASEAPEPKVRLIRVGAWVFLGISLIWAPVFWSAVMPHTVFKLELTLLTFFVCCLRLLVVRGLQTFQIWAWGLLFLFLGTDLCLTFVAFHKAVFAIHALFSLMLIRQLLNKEVRQVFGFKTSADAISRFGIARTFQNIRLFASLSVLDNVKIGAHRRIRSGVLSSLLNLKSKMQEERAIETESIECLKFVGIERYAFDLAGSLPYGEQRRLEIARALASKPELLLLDEPAAGMNPTEASRLTDLIREIRGQGMTVLIIEHNMKVMMNLADVIYVLDHGEGIAFGTPDEIRNNPRVIEAYLGKGAAHVPAET